MLVLCTTCNVSPHPSSRNITSTTKFHDWEEQHDHVQSPLVYKHRRQLFGVWNWFNSYVFFTGTIYCVTWGWAIFPSLVAADQWCGGWTKIKIILISETGSSHQHHFQPVSPKLKHEHLSWLWNIISQCNNIHMLVSQQSIISFKIWKNSLKLNSSHETFPFFIQSRVKLIRKMLRTKPKHDQKRMNQSNANKNSGLSAVSKFSL